MTDDELEQMFRATLRHRAGDVTTDGRMAPAARGMARRRQHFKAAAAGVAAVAVIAPVGVLAALHGNGDSPVEAARPGSSTSGPTPGGTTDASTAPSGVPASWRVESYDGVQLRVPPDWGWGGVPMKDFGGSQALMTCGNGAFAYPGPDDKTLLKVNVDMPYVGRANYGMTDLCVGGLPTPTKPYVWLGSPLEVGTEQLADGFSQRTVDVAGVRVTVADDDPDELATILGTVEAVDVDANGCEPASRLAESGDAVTGLDTVDSVSVCAYRHTEGAGVFLGYSTSIKGATAQQLLERVKAAPTVMYRCSPQPRLDDVMLRFHGPAGHADVLVRLDGCSGYYTGEGIRPLTRANVEPWVVDGVGLYVDGGQVGNALSGLFHQPPG